jgi:hypothetical protein
MRGIITLLYTLTCNFPSLILVSSLISSPLPQAFVGILEHIQDNPPDYDWVGVDIHRYEIHADTDLYRSSPFDV